jgi:serine protease Do
MARLSLLVGLVLLFTPSALLCADDLTPSKEVLAIQSAVQNVIERAQPSVACVLVSRSDAYRKLFQDEPPADNPGKLGSFDPSIRSSLAAPRRQLRSPSEPTKKYDLADTENVPEAFGTGVIIDGRQHLILTTYHAVHDATKIYVRLPGGKGSYADIHAADPRSDLAVLRLVDETVGPLMAIRFGDGDNVRKGQFIVALTNPFAAGFRDGSPSASWGIISNLRQRAANFGYEEPSRQPQNLYLLNTLLQTDAQMNIGSDGGALVNLYGEMIGLTTSRPAVPGSETSGHFAIPIDANIKRLIERLRQGKEVEYGFLGVRSAEKREPCPEGGVRIEEVTSGSPASLAELSPRECIISINGTRVRNFEDLTLAISTLLAGSEARLELNGHNKIVRVELAKTYVPGKVIAANRPPAVRGFRVDYTSVLWMQSQANGNQFQFARFRANMIQPGVYVSEVQPGGPAATARLQVNDIITAVNGQEVNTPAQFYREVAKIARGTPLELTLAGADMNREASTKIVIH